MMKVALVVVVASLALVMAAERPGSFVRTWGPTSVRLGGVSPAAAETAQGGQLTALLSGSLVQFMEDYRQTLVTGSELHPPLDPFLVDEIGPIDIGTDGLVPYRVRANLNELSVSGVSDFVLRELLLNPVALRLNFRLTLPTIRILSEYNIEYRLSFLTVLRASGSARIDFNNMTVDFVAKLALVNGSLQATEMQLDLDVGETFVNLTEVTGLGVIDLVLNYVLENFSTDVVQIALANVSQAVSDELTETINDVLGRWSLNSIPEDLLINQYIDDALPHISKFIVDNDLDPMSLPDLEEGFEYKPLLITYRGQLLINEGQLTNLKSLRRSEDTFVRYIAQMLRVRVALGFEDLEIRYNYLAKLMDIGPTGGLRGSLDRIDLLVDVLFDFNNLELHLQQFDMTSGRLRVRLTGNVLTDWFVNSVSTTFLRLFDNVIFRVVETTMRDVMQEQIQRLNDLIKSELAV